MNQRGKIKMEYGYARVSTQDQSLELQVEALVKAGVPVENIFSEKFSGKNTKRPEWSKLEGTEKLKDGQKMDGILKEGGRFICNQIGPFRTFCI
jgi:DNA invertase Pin-like site-specific DNA recombinase